ncbi:MAG TPA: glycosyltransferase [Patescibacteria group bacterium]|nr:glycosyltransferase [Patescibacteria group bacterium]
MKILYIITQGEQGGAQKNVFDSAMFMKGAGLTVYVAHGKLQKVGDEWLDRELLENKFELSDTHVLSSLRRSINPWHDIKAFFQIYRLIKKLRVDIVHAHSSKAGVLAAWGAKLAGVKSVYTAHGFVFLEPLSKLKKAFYIAAEYLASFARDLTLTVSEYDLIMGQKFHVLRKSKSKVLHNGIDPAKLTAVLSAAEARRVLFSILGVPDTGEKLVGTVANLYETKGLFFLIQAAKKNSQGIRYIVIGEGELRPQLEAQVEHAGLKNSFHLPGSIPDAYKYLKGFDLLVLPSVKEGFPYFVLEALAVGMPIVATQVGGIPEALEGHEAYLVAPRDPHVLANAIAKHFENPARETFTLPKEFYVSNTMQSLLASYKSIL